VAQVWGVFMGVSANSRFQVLVGLERVLEGTLLVHKQPWVALVGIVTLRLLNNVVGGEHFVEMAKAAGLH
jgi:hypothetical protein